MALFEGQEPAAGAMERLLLEAHDAGTPLLMTTVNLGEIWYSSARAKSEAVAEERVSDVRKLGVEVVAADWPLAREAARYKSKGGISYADCFALSLAKSRRGDLVTGDREFKPFAGDVRILWL
jgi:ribonuclease VapC